MANLTIDNVLDGIVATLVADTTLTALLGNGSTSVFQWTKHSFSFDDLSRSLVASPFIAVSWESDKWNNQGLIHQRKFYFLLEVAIYDVRGVQQRLETAKPIIDRIYTTLINSQLGNTAQLDYVDPERSSYIVDIPDQNGNPLEISVFQMEFSTGLIFQ